jgi:hypothetical protein
MGSHPERLAVIPDTDTDVEAAIRLRFAHLSDGEVFRAEPELLNYIDANSVRWEPTVKYRRSKTGSPSEERQCERCNVTYRTAERYRFCPKCQSAIRDELWAAGYLKTVPKQAPWGYSDTGRVTEPDPWQENAVKAMEDG